MRRQQRPGLDLISIGTPECCDFDLTLFPLPNEDFNAMLYRLEDVLSEFKAIPVLQFAFGSVESLRGGPAAMQRVFGGNEWPVTWIDGVGATTKGLGGLQVLAVSNRKVTRVKHQGQVVGSIFDNGPARNFLLGGLGTSVPGAPKPEQTRVALEELQSLLASHGFSMGEVVRTWFYLEDILSWYDDFNKVRTSIYKQHAFRVGSLPASTGVAAKNPAGSALGLAAWAVQSVNGGVFPAREIISPLQCPAPAYGSSFSRAVEIDLPAGRRLLVSGTASIEPGGKTVWGDNPQQQIQLTMEVVYALLKSRGMDFKDIARASLYFKQPEYVAAFSDWCARHSQKLTAGLPIHCDICRGDLLFEIELDTVIAG